MGTYTGREKKSKPPKKNKTQEKEKVHIPLWYNIIITINRNYSQELKESHERIVSLINNLVKNEQGFEVSPFLTDDHLFARLQAKTILELVEADQKSEKRAIYQIWPDFELNALLNKSVHTIGANSKATGENTSGFGEGITWAVLDSGIAAAINSGRKLIEKYMIKDKIKTIADDSFGHRHFFDSTIHHSESYHRDFTVNRSQDGPQPDERPFIDESGHGTHVAGIIAGAAVRITPNGGNYFDYPFFAYRKELNESESRLEYKQEKVENISGVAPLCKLVSLKIMSGPEGVGTTRSVLAAITHIIKCNNKNPKEKDRIHGINISAGYEFNPKWYGCGHSPLCEVLNNTDSNS